MNHINGVKISSVNPIVSFSLKDQCWVILLSKNMWNLKMKPERGSFQCYKTKRVFFRMCDSISPKSGYISDLSSGILGTSIPSSFFVANSVHIHCNFGLTFKKLRANHGATPKSALDRCSLWVNFIDCMRIFWFPIP